MLKGDLKPALTLTAQVDRPGGGSTPSDSLSHRGSCCCAAVLLGQGLSKSSDILFKAKACLILYGAVWKWMDVFLQID